MTGGTDNPPPAFTSNLGGSDHPPTLPFSGGRQFSVQKNSSSRFWCNEIVLRVVLCVVVPQGFSQSGALGRGRKVGVPTRPLPPLGGGVGSPQRWRPSTFGETHRKKKFTPKIVPGDRVPPGGGAPGLKWQVTVGSNGEAEVGRGVQAGEAPAPTARPRPRPGGQPPTGDRAVRPAMVHAPTLWDEGSLS